MAFTAILFIVSMAAIVNAVFPGFPDANFPGFGPPMRFPRPPPFPNMFGFPAYPNLPPPPQLFYPGAFAMPPMPPMPPMPAFPSVDEIASGKPENGGTFDGLIMTTKSEGKRDENGEIVRKGGSTVVLNKNGEVTVHKIGESPPEVIIEKLKTPPPPFPDFPEPKFPEFAGAKFPEFPEPEFPEFPGPEFPDFPGPKFNKGFKPNPFKPHKPFKPLFEPFEFKPIDPEFIKNYVPKEGEDFHSSSSSSHSFSSNVNGKKESGGSASTMVNDNGKMKEDQLAFHKADP